MIKLFEEEEAVVAATIAKFQLEAVFDKLISEEMDIFNSGMIYNDECSEEEWSGCDEIKISPWVLKFDSLSTETPARARIFIKPPTGTKTTLSFSLDFECTNNQAEYEELISLEILLELGSKQVKVMGDSQLVLRQLSGEYNCNSIALAPYFTVATQLLESFKET
ncbi:hypothetical protein GH714_002758 [Hevea brasiliensis]|uniref:RNase H type-1 domain-containing protein n=1 Tax=Hevea brasiliensis TaxID=3981 RepID=A0A6A6KMF7_HEVBR|nr:hypothetical protein GH714_002758 [Hevea brasiliensis]